jgi:cytochrome c biogenesis protein CcdA
MTYSHSHTTTLHNTHAYQSINSDEEAVDDWTRKEEENKEHAIQEQLDEELHPQRHIIHKFFILISVVTMLSSVMMGMGQLVGIFYEQQDAIQLVLRMYVILLCWIVFLNEMEWTKYTTDSTILRLWITRGICYMFVGVLGLAENDKAMARDETTVGNAAATVYFATVAWFIIVCGMLYTVLGIFCMQLVNDRMRSTFAAKEERAKATERTTFLYGSNATPQEAVTPEQNVV